MDAYEVDCSQIEVGFLLELPMAMHSQGEDGLSGGGGLPPWKFSCNTDEATYVFERWI
jgi:hypothetical protein